MRAALQIGYERVEMALLAAAMPESHADDAWRHNDPPPIPSMTANQALQLLYLHQKEARLWDERPDRRQRIGETSEAWRLRLQIKWDAELRRDAEDLVIAEQLAEAPAHPPAHQPPAPSLPALDQVTGWSNADPAGRVHHVGVALFGGWRLEDWEGGK